MLNVVMLSVLAPFLMPHADRQTKEEIDGGMDRQIKGNMDGLTYRGWMDRWTDRLQMDRQRSKNRCMNGQTNRQTTRRTEKRWKYKEMGRH
jgi:hypothetical protein